MGAMVALSSASRRYRIRQRLDALDSATMAPMSSTYNGPATLINGADEIPVTADLHIETAPAYDAATDGGFVEAQGTRRSWLGTLAADEPFAAQLGRTYDLRFPDGATGRVRARMLAADSDTPQADTLAVTGEGPAPWNPSGR